MPADQEVASFIRATFRSIWSLELLFLLRTERERLWSRPEMVARLRASDLVVNQGLDQLVTGGLVVIEEDGRARYQPVPGSLDGTVEAAQRYYSKSPDAVRRLIVAAANPGLAAFADSFRLKKD